MVFFEATEIGVHVVNSPGTTTLIMSRFRPMKISAYRDVSAWLLHWFFTCSQVGGMGLGDDLAAALATVMPILRGVERLVAFDNRLTDFSLFRIIQAVQGMPSLTYVGEVCACLSTLVGSHIIGRPQTNMQLAIIVGCGTQERC